MEPIESRDMNPPEHQTIMDSIDITLVPWTWIWGLIVIIVPLLTFIALFFIGCTSITRIGVIPETEIVCHSVKDTGFFAAGILLVCTRDGVVQAASGGAAAGPAGIATGAVGATGVAAAGAFIGSGLRSLSTPQVDGTVRTEGTLRLVP